MVAIGRRPLYVDCVEKLFFGVDHNLGFGRAVDLAACGSPMRFIVTITRADEVRRVKSRFSRPVILRVFHTIRRLQPSGERK
jgi:hypothetical protein